jgi:hypothetical protein
MGLVAGSLGLGPSALMGLSDRMIAVVSGVAAVAHSASLAIVAIAA